MTQNLEQPGSVENELDAAKAIVEMLRDWDKQKQERALRFATETLGLCVPASVTGSAELPLGESPPAIKKAPVADQPIRTTDIKQFTEAKSPKTDQQFAAVVAYYYRFEAPEERRKDSIGVKDLLEAVRLAERKRPGSPLATLNNAKKKGYLDAVGRAKFQINSVGENLVAMTLPARDNPPSVRKKRRSIPRKAKAKSAKKKRRRTTR